MKFVFSRIIKSGVYMNKFKSWLIISAIILALLTACSGGGSGGSSDGGDTTEGSSPPATSGDYVLFAWNDLGMHCLNPTYDTAVILPPYNTVWAQLVRRGSPPQLVTTGVSLEYRIVNNTSSADKTSNTTGADYGQFWTYVQQLFGVSLATDTGLNLKDPNRNNGLSGTMVVYGNHFEVNGIPLTPVDDNGQWNPYQVMEITARNGSGTIIAQTRTTVPTSDEIHCDKCHGGSNPFLDILEKHDDEIGTDLVNNQPVLCASCHGSPVLGGSGKGAAGIYLSEAIHGSHADRGAGCYDCHPGANTQCNRSLAHNGDNAADGNCEACHGTMQQVANSINEGRIPWESEPRCVDCHTGVAEVDTGTTLYRNADGHGGLNCAACHGSPHAMIPSREAVDNYQAIQYQEKALTIGSCGVCHDNSRGEGSGEFLEEHGSNNETACNICHTVVTTNDTSLWPHQYQWRGR